MPEKTPQQIREENRQQIINATQGNLWGKTFGNGETALASRFADEVLSHQRGGGAGPSLNPAQQIRIAVSLNTIAKAWKQDNNVLDRMSATINGNATLKLRMGAIGSHDPVRFAAISADYTSNPNDLASSINSAYSQLPAAVRQRAEAEAAPRRTPAPAPRAEAPAPRARTQSPASPSPRERQDAPEPRRETSPQSRSERPAADSSAETTPRPAVIAGAAGVGFTAEDIRLEGGILDMVGSKLEQMFPDMASQIQTFKNTIRGDAALQARIAENLNNNPEFMAELEKLGQNGHSGNTALLQQFGRQPVLDLLTHPEKLADNAYVDSMTAQLKGASGGVGGMLQNLLGNLNLGGLGGQIMGFLQPLIDMLGDLFRGFGANGGNVISMTNGSGNMLSNLMGNLGTAMHLGAAMRSNDPYLLAQAQVVDRNNDGRINDADKYEVTDASGNKHNVYETRGLTDGRNAQGQILRAYVSEIDPANGQPKGMKTITVTADGNVTTVDANAPPAAQTPPPTPAPANQELANRNNNTPSPGGVDMAPNSGLGGIY